MIASLYDAATGRYLRYIEAPDEANLDLNIREGEIRVDGYQPENSYFADGEVRLMPDKPEGEHWVFDPASASWTDPRPKEEAEAALLAALRWERDRRLAASDWTQMPDAPLDDDQRAAWRAYRQALRDLTATEDPAEPLWPVPPNQGSE